MQYFLKLNLAIILILFFQTASANEKTHNTTIMVTAATGSFGEAICSDLASKNYNLIIAGRNANKLENLKNNLLKKYPKITIQSIIIDFANLSSITTSSAQISQQSINGIVLIPPRPILTKNDIPNSKEWLKVFTETFVAPLELLRSFDSQIKPNSSIIIICGSSSKSYLPDYSNTNIIRLAWVGEIKNLSHFFGKRKIRVNAISPGPILTEFHLNKINNKALKNNLTFEEQMTKDTTNIPLNSYGKTEDVSNLVEFLLSAKSSHLNSMNILLDGGESSAY